MGSVLVLDGQQRSALAATRSLGKRGLDVYVADVQVPTLAGSSRYARAQLQCPDLSHNPDEFVDWIARTTLERRIDVVLPATDSSTMILAAARKRMPHLRIACGPTDAYEAVSNKANLMELARRNGVQIPATCTVSNLDEFRSQVKDARFPLVLKPARSKALVDGKIVSAEVYVASSADDALNHIQTQNWFGPVPCLLQEFVEGHGAGVFAFYSNGQAVAWFSHKRLREKPPSGGISVLSESVAAPEALRLSAQRILDAAQWSGAAMVEFRVSASGQPYLMEINARLWGSIQLAIDSGIDFPWLAYSQAVGDTLQVIPTYATGRRLRWLLGDLDSLIISLRRSRLRPADKLKTVGRFFAAFFDLRSRQEVLRWQDPMPALVEVRNWIKALL